MIAKTTSIILRGRRLSLLALRGDHCWGMRAVWRRRSLPAKLILPRPNQTGFIIQRKCFSTDRTTENIARPSSGAADNMAKDQQELPKLSPAEFRQYNRMADQMEGFVSFTASAY